MGENVIGDNGEVSLLTTNPGGTIDQLFLNAGYLGTMTMVSRPGSPWGQHTYVVAVSEPILRDGQPLTLGWDAESMADPMGIHNEIYDALVYTFAPGLPPRLPPDDCYVSGDCVLTGANTGERVSFWPGLGTGVVIGAQGTPMDGAIVDIQLAGPLRDFAFDHAATSLQLSAKGLTLVANDVGLAHVTCSLGLGSKLSDVMAGCVDVTGSSAGDAARDVVFFGGLVRGSETYTRTTPGVSMDIHADTLGPFDVITDCQLPVGMDRVSAIRIDQSSQLTLSNDYSGADRDVHGLGFVFLEYARLVQNALQGMRADLCEGPMSCPPGQAPRRTLGDPACLDPNVKIDSSGNPVLAQGCTGFEGFFTPAPQSVAPTADEPYLNAIAGGAFAVPWPDGSLTLSPSYLTAFFCTELVSQSANHCDGTTGGLSGGVFSTSSARVLSVFGKNDPESLPIEARDPIFFAKMYATALAKYFVAAGQGTETAEAVHAVPIAPWDLETSVSADIIKLRYVDRALASSAAPPVLTVGIDLDSGVDFYELANLLERSEIADYETQMTPGAILAGATGDDIALTNVFGSLLLRSIWGAEDPGCAVGTGSACVQGPPLADDGTVALDDDGSPLLQRYQSAIKGTSPVAIGQVTAAVSTPFTIMMQGVPSSFAKVSFPSLGMPFDALVPYRAPADSTVYVEGLNDQMISVSLPALSFTGRSVDLDVSYDVGASPGTIAVQVVSARLFEGRVFLCFDPASQSLLSVHLGDRLENVSAWIDHHPAAAKACHLELPADAVPNPGPLWSVQYGVEIGVDVDSRVTSAMLWDPKLSQ